MAACHARSRAMNSQAGNKMPPTEVSMAHKNMGLLTARRPSAAATPASVTTKHSIAFVAATSAKREAITAGSCRADAAARCAVQ